MQLKSCPICNSSKIKPLYSATTTSRIDEKIWHVWQCECSHEFMNPQPSWAELAPYYAEDYHPYGKLDDRDAADIAHARETGFVRHMPITKGSRILDVGCGGGQYLRVIKALGAEGYGVEPSEFAAKSCRDQGLNVFTGMLVDYVKTNPGTFDIVGASHVVEHLPDPVETFRLMKSLLAPGGTVWIAVPNATYPIHRAIPGKHIIADLPVHLMHFTPKSIVAAAKRAGLSVVKQRTESLPHHTEGSLGALLRYKLMIPRRVSHKLRLARPFAKWYAARTERLGIGESIITEFAA